MALAHVALILSVSTQILQLTLAWFLLWKLTTSNNFWTEEGSFVTDSSFFHVFALLYFNYLRQIYRVYYLKSANCFLWPSKHLFLASAYTIDHGGCHSHKNMTDKKSRRFRCYLPEISDRFVTVLPGAGQYYYLL